MDSTTDLDTKEPLSNASDCSFVILERGSPPPSIKSEADAEFRDENQNNFGVFELKSERNAPNDKQSFLEDDIQEKLKQLVKENYQLKETLNQNNLAMKSQLDTFYMWQQEVLKTHETHKKKFMETKDLILKLRAENVNLKKQLEEVGGDDDSDLQMYKRLDLSDEYSLKMEIDKFKNMYEDLMNKNEILETDNINLKEKLKGLGKEVLKLNSDLEDVMRENKFLKHKINELNKSSWESLSHGSLPNSEARAQINNLFNQLEMERSKVTMLKEKLKKGSEIVLKLQNLSKGLEMEEYMRNLEELNVLFDNQNQRFNSLQSWVSLGEGNFYGEDGNLFREGKEQKKSHISEEEKTWREKEKSLEYLRGEFKKLLENYKGLQEELSFIEKKDLDVEKYKNEVVSLSEKLTRKEEEVLSKEKECDKLKEEIKKLNLECEEMFALKLQLELHEKSLKEEQEDREKLVREKQEMAEEIRCLIREFEVLKKKEAEEPKSFFRCFRENKSNYTCPKCYFSFSDEETFGEHVGSCVNDYF